MNRPRLGLGTRMTLAMVGSMTVLLTILGAIYIRHCQHSQEALIQQSEDRLGDMIRRATRLAMLRNDREELAGTLSEIGRSPQLMRVRIYDKKGAIRYSSSPEEIGMMVDLTADACDRCHSTATPLSRLERSDRTRIYKTEGQRVMGSIHPVPNEPACGDAPCHFHPADQTVLGVLDVQMSLTSVDEMVADRIRSFAFSSLIALILIYLLSVLWVWRTVNRPVRDLLAATRAISAGDLEQRVPDSLGTDLRELVDSFNQMTADLQAARRESEEWARSLERRVEVKSRALQRAQDEMVQVEKMASLGKLAAIVAHEINNPLAGIRTYAKLLLKKLQRREERTDATGEVPPAVVAPPPEAADWLARIESEAARCGEIVRNLLAFTRSSHPKAEPSDINHVIQESIRLVHHQFELSSIEHTLRLAPDLPQVECDAQQIKQALLAILINACEAMPQGGQITVESASRAGIPQTEGGGALEQQVGRGTSGGGDADRAAGAAASSGAQVSGVEIRIRDSGLGMDAETRKHVFEPFFTTKEGTASGGTGLGLAVVYTIVRSHGGSIAVESSPGSGSLFRIWLPLRLDRVEEVEHE